MKKTLNAIATENLHYIRIPCSKYFFFILHLYNFLAGSLFDKGAELIHACILQGIPCLGCYAEGTESYNFIPTGHEYYYMVWMVDGSVMPLSVSKKADREYLDALTDATYDYVDGKTDMIEMEPRTFLGTVKTQESEANQYYREALTYLEISEADGWVVRNVLLDCTKTRASYILLCGGVMMIPVIGIATTIVTAKKEKRKRDNPTMDYLPH